MPSVDGPSKCSVVRRECWYLDQTEQVPASRRDIGDAHRECGREDQVEQAMNNVLCVFHRAGVNGSGPSPGGKSPDQAGAIDQDEQPACRDMDRLHAVPPLFGKQIFALRHQPEQQYQHCRQPVESDTCPVVAVAFGRMRHCRR